MYKLSPLFLLAACTPPAASLGTRIQQNPPDVTEWYWIKAHPLELKGIADNEYNKLYRESVYVPRISAWLTELDAAFRRNVSGLEKIPKPQFLIGGTVFDNAHAPLFCMKMSEKDGEFFAASKPSSDFIQKSRLCVMRHEAKPETVVAHYNKAAQGAGTKCTIQKTESGFVYSAECKWQQDFKKAPPFQALGIPPYIVFAQSFLNGIQKEEHAVAILAHELIHYYYAHGLRAHEYNIVYKMQGRDKWHKPVRNPQYAELEKEYQNLLEESFSAKSEVPNAKEFLTKLQKQGLGIYTYEQEADEFSVALLAEIGVDPESFESYFKSSLMSSPDLGKCLRSIRQWNESGRQDSSAPQLGTIEGHHSTCYRYFNLQLEGPKQKYTLKERKLKFDETWDALKVRAQRN